MAKEGLHALDIFEGQPVGDHAFETVPHFDAHLAFVGRDDQQDAVIAFGIAQRPFAPEPIAVIGDIVALQVGYRRDHELALVGVLELVELLRQRGFGGVVDDVGGIDDRRRSAFGKLLRGGGQGEAQYRRQRQDHASDEAHCSAAQLAASLSERMFSSGATSAPCVTASYGTIGSAP